MQEAIHCILRQALRDLFRLGGSDHAGLHLAPWSTRPGREGDQRPPEWHSVPAHGPGGCVQMSKGQHRCGLWGWGTEVGHGGAGVAGAGSQWEKLPETPQPPSGAQEVLWWLVSQVLACRVHASPDRMLFRLCQT